MESVSDIDVVLADNQPLTLSGLRSAVEDHSDIRILGECTDRQDMWDAVRDHSPHVLVVSAELLEEDLDALQALTAENQETRVILLTSRNDITFLQEVLRNGARGVVQREKPVHHIPIAIRKVTKGELWFERDITARMINNLLQNPKSKKDDIEEQKISAITTREQEVIGLICEGLRNKEVSDRLHISEATVSHHLTSIFRKLDIEDRVSLVIYAVRKRLVTL
jgi:two-component system, NarL family, response regulator DegU